MPQTSAGGRPTIRVSVFQNSAVYPGLSYRVAATYVAVVKSDSDIAKIYASASTLN